LARVSIWSTVALLLKRFLPEEGINSLRVRGSLGGFCKPCRAHP
jgi:hypothetical protein